MAAVTSITKFGISGSPAFEKKVYVYKYTKAGATDTLDISGEFSAVDMVLATTSVGTYDAASNSSLTLTFATGTGAGTALVVGDA